MLEISEAVNVWVFFRQNRMEPYVFFWRGRKIKVDKVNLVHSSKNGATIFYHFALSANGNFYQLRFDSNKLNWILERVEEDL